MTSYINHFAQIMFLELRRIKQIRSFLNEGAVKTLVSSFILSRLQVVVLLVIVVVVVVLVVVVVVLVLVVVVLVFVVVVLVLVVL